MQPNSEQDQGPDKRALARGRRKRRQQLEQFQKTGKRNAGKEDESATTERAANNSAEAQGGISRRGLLYAAGGGTLLTLSALAVPEVRYLTGLQERPDKMVLALEAVASMSQEGATPRPGRSARLAAYQMVLGVSFHKTMSSYLKPQFPNETIISMDFGGGAGHAAAEVNSYEGVEVFVLDRGHANGQFSVTSSKDGPLLPINRYLISPAEDTGLKSGIVHHIFSHNATQYFDFEHALPEMYRLLRVGGVAQFDFEGWRAQSEVVAKSSIRKNMYITTTPISIRQNAVPSQRGDGFSPSLPLNNREPGQEQFGQAPYLIPPSLPSGAAMGGLSEPNGVMWRGSMERFLATIPDLVAGKEGTEFMQLVLMHPSVVMVRTEEGRFIRNIEAEVRKPPLTQIVSHPGGREGLVDATGRPLSLPEAMEIAGMTPEKAKELLHEHRERRKQAAELYEQEEMLHKMQDLRELLDQLGDGSGKE